MEDRISSAERVLVGRALPRVEDRRFLLGDARYIADVKSRDVVSATFIRSWEAHARIGGIELGRALECDGVVLALTGSDVRTRTHPIRADSLLPGWQGTDYWALANEWVRYVGEPVACIVASDRYLAEDAAEFVDVSYEPFPVIRDIHEALELNAPILHEGWVDNCFIKLHFETERFDDAMQQAPHKLSLELDMARHTGMPLETRGCIAHWDASTESLTLWVAAQAPHLLRTALADVLKLPENRVRIISPDVGGGFGIKLPLYPEYVVCALAAMDTGKAVTWLEDRREHMLASSHAREHEHKIEVGFDSDGRVLALEARVLVDIGAYSIGSGSATLDPGMALGIMPGPYRIRNYRADAWSVATNKTPHGPYRGVARPAACFSIERAMDAIAESLDLDPADVRRRNLIPEEEFPYTSASGLEYDSGFLTKSLDTTLERIGYSQFRSVQQKAREEGRYLGIGLAVYVEQTGHTWGEFKKRGLLNTFGHESATVRIDPSGSVTIEVSSHSHGQGHETTFAQIASDELSTDIGAIRVVFGDTASTPYGNGTFASRSAVLCGGATYRAANVVRQKLQMIAAHLLEAAPEDLQLSEGMFTVQGAPWRTVSIPEIARVAHHQQHLMPEGEEPTLVSTMSYDAFPGTGTFANEALAVIVEVDPLTGLVSVQEIVVTEDCGQMINPAIVEGQIHGGIVQGVGSALFEELSYDATGQPVVTTMMDYLMPGSADVPLIDVQHLETPSRFTLLGIKGVGEGGTIGPGAAIAAAVEDAIRPLTEARIDTLPLTPERVLGWIEQGRRA